MRNLHDNENDNEHQITLYFNMYTTLFEYGYNIKDC